MKVVTRILLLVAMALAVFSIATVAKADGFYLRAGLYAGHTDYKVAGDGYGCVSKDTRGNCYVYDRNYEVLEGPFGKVEIGYRAGNVDVSCFHLSSTSTNRDSGWNLCGFGVVFGR